MTEESPPLKLLFICTGNYYRSRFAEAVFNHHAEERGLPWRAFSRGLSLVPGRGPLSPYTADALARRGVDLRHTGTCCVTLGELDLGDAARVIALQEAEHRPLMARRFPEWEARIEYWDVADLPHTTVEEALPRIEARVLELLAELAGG